MVQRFIKCMMTPLNSDPSDATYGTGFANLIGGNVNNPNDLQDAVSMFVGEAQSQLQALDSLAGLADNERLSTATLTDFGLAAAGDGFTAYVTLVSIAGPSQIVVLPTLYTRPS
jgi:hypothetical protein